MGTTRKTVDVTVNNAKTKIPSARQTENPLTSAMPCTRMSIDHAPLRAKVHIVINHAKPTNRDRAGLSN